MKKHSFNPNLMFNDVAQLAREHGADSLQALGKEFYDRTECGISTMFLTYQDSQVKKFHYESRDPRIEGKMPQNQWPIRNVVGIKLTTIVEGSDAELSLKPLYFPFSDEELAEAWDKLEAFAEESREE